MGGCGGGQIRGHALFDDGHGPPVVGRLGGDGGGRVDERVWEVAGCVCCYPFARRLGLIEPSFIWLGQPPSHRLHETNQVP